MAYSLLCCYHSRILDTGKLFDTSSNMGVRLYLSCFKSGKYLRKGGWRFASRLTIEGLAPSIAMNYSFWRQRCQLSLLGLILVFGLSACVGLNLTPSVQPTVSINNNPGNLTPTPTAPAYLVGATVNNNTFTSTSGTLIVYVAFHHGQLPQAGGRVSLYFHYEGGGGIPGLNNQAGTRTTGSDGFAVFYIGFSGLPTDTPIAIDVTVHFSGIPDIVKKDAASFSVVNVTPSVTPSPPGNGG
jgi:hypothetical protein